jgi:hypothetical protein
MALLINPYRFASSSFNPADLFLAGGIGFFIDFDIAKTALKKNSTDLVTADGDAIDRFAVTYCTGTSGEFRRSGTGVVYRTNGGLPYAEVSSGSHLWTTWDGGWGVEHAYDMTKASKNGNSEGATVCAAMRPQNNWAGMYWDYSNTDPGFGFSGTGQLSVRRRRVTADAYQTAESASGYSGTDIVATVVSDFSAAGNAIKGRVSGTEVVSTTPLSTGQMAGGTYQMSIDENDNSGTARRYYAAFAISRVLSAGELTSLENWMKARAGIA